MSLYMHATETITIVTVPTISVTVNLLHVLYESLCPSQLSK